MNNVVLPAPFGPMIDRICAGTGREAHAVDGLHAAEGDADIRCFEDGHERAFRRSRLERLGTMPLRMKIIATMMMRPSRRCSYSWNTVSACGSVTSRAAPTMLPSDRPQPAEHDHGDELHGVQEARLIRIDEAVHEGKGRSCQRGIDGSDHEGLQLEPGDIDAHHLGCHLAVVQRAEGPARRRLVEIERDPGADEQEAARHPIPGIGPADPPAEQVSRSTGMPSGPPVQRLSVVMTSATRTPRPKGRDGEIMPFEPQDRAARQDRREPPRAPRR